MRARGMGARVIVCEVDSLKALEAAMDGFEVMPLKEIASRGDIFVTSTGDSHVINKSHFSRMKDGALVANAGHFNVEINLQDLEEMSLKKRKIRGVIEEFTLASGRRINLLAEGRLVNLAAAEGHPSAVMDMSFANQALSCEYLAEKGGEMKVAVHGVPPEIDQWVAELKLKTLGIKIDKLSEEQKEYLSSWKIGT